MVLLTGRFYSTVPRGKAVGNILIILQTSYVSGSKALKLTDSMCSSVYLNRLIQVQPALIHFTPELSLATETQRDAGDFVPL